MEQDFQNSVINSMNICIEKIDYILYYYELIGNNSENILDLLKQNNKFVPEDIKKSFFRGLDINIEKLKKTLMNAKSILEKLETEKIDNIQYETFLKNELVNFNWSQQLPYLQSHYIDKSKEFIARIEKGETFTQEDFQCLDVYVGMVQNNNFAMNLLIGKVSSIAIFNHIGHIKNNIVIIGANGSGKSTFARNLNGKLGDNFVIISAQHLLVYNKPQNILIGHKELELVREFQKSNKLGSDSNLTDLFRNDFTNLVMALFEEKAKREHAYYNKIESRKDSILDRAIEIWGNLITHRQIVNSEQYELEVRTPEGDIYDFNYLSDGEKAIFYYIGHVLLAEKNSYIIIDEPENHLHLSICTELWNILENERNDCIFIYITHNIDFAVSRNNKTLLWNKKFLPPFDWEVEEIESDNDIPDVLMFQIVGCRKNVVFCEGDDRNSLDYKIYSQLFNDYNVIPVQGHDTVIKYCNSFNRNKGLSGIKAFGIIDGDAWSEDEINSLKEDNIMVLPYNEMENFICDSKILNYIAKATGSSKEAVSNYISKFFDIVSTDKKRQAVWYANNSLNNYLKHNMLKKDKYIEELESEVNTIVSTNSVRNYYNIRIEQLEKHLSEEDYNALIKLVNLKKKLTRELANKFIVNNYEERVINLIRNEEKFLNYIKDNFLKQYFSLLF